MDSRTRSHVAACGPRIADHGYRVVAPWLPGYAGARSTPISVGTYVRAILQARQDFRGDERTLLVGHDWGANAGYGAVAIAPEAFRRFVALAVPPTAALGTGMFEYAQLKRSFYIWFIQQVGLAEMALVQPGFWESLWADWSPGYDPSDDIAELRRHVTADNIAAVISPYRASFNPDLADPAARRNGCNDDPAARRHALPARRSRRSSRRGPAHRRRPPPAGRRITV